jgi:hypothetical protein
MNIFAIDDNPILAARGLPDSLIVKTPATVMQILSLKNYGHSLTDWTKESKSNMHWLCIYGLNICEEYFNRYEAIHPTCGELDEIYNNLSGLDHWRDHTEFVQIMPIKYKIPGNPVQAYRNYIQLEKTYYAEWKNNNKPSWWVIE